MNAAIRAVVRTAAFKEIKISAVFQGYQGLISGNIEEFTARSVANIIQRGGTILRTARCLDFMEPEGRAKAAKNLAKHGIDGLVVIGGDGSFKGATKLHQEHGFPVIGIPATIDNDIYGTDVTIGFNTAIDIALRAIDRLRDTAASHNRLFLAEVMGRNAGHIALYVGVAVGAEAILVPEVESDLSQIYNMLEAAEKKGKTSSIAVIAEGAYKGGAMAIQKKVLKKTNYEVRTSILGHIQRGGSPVTRDRVLASRLGYAAVKGLIAGRSGVMVGADKRDVVFVPLSEVFEKERNFDWELYEAAKVLAI